jgi:3-methyladenine DNA glycosylase AlkD
MTVDEVHALLETLRDPRGAAHFERRFGGSGLRAVGVGLTALRKLAREIGRDPALAAQLWTDGVYEARVLSLLIDDPKRITRAQAEAQVEQLEVGQLAHVFASCDAALAKTPFVRELAEAWMASPDPMRQRCGHGLLAELGKEKGKKAPDEAWFAQQVQRIAAALPGADPQLRLAMGYALITIGKRSAALNRAALAVAQAMGPVDWDETGACEPFDAVKHIDNPRLRGLLGVDAG